jgi:DNA-binding NtrC family response regulator
MTTPAPRILIVDDQLGPRESLRMHLKHDYEVRAAESGREALEWVRLWHPDVVLLDFKMPEMDGLEVLRHLKRLDPTIEVVMVTAYDSLETVRVAQREGAPEVLIKPFNREDLVAAVRRAIERRHAGAGSGRS